MYAGPAHLQHLVLPPTDDKLTKRRTPEVEPYFGTLYWVDVLPEDLLAGWIEPPTVPRLGLPPRNQFHPTDFTLVESSESHGPTESKTESKDEMNSTSVFEFTVKSSHPSKLFDSDGFTLWYLIDQNHKLPKVEIFLSFSSHAAVTSPLRGAMNDLFVRVLQDALAEIVYMAEMSQLHSELVSNDIGFLVHINGFSDKALVLLNAIMGTLLESVSYMSIDRVERQMDRLGRSYENENMKASKSASNARLCAMKRSKYSADRKLAAMKDCSKDSGLLIEELTSFVKAFMSGCCVNMLVYGNLSSMVTLQVAHDLRELMASSGATCAASCHPSQQIAIIPKDQFFLITVSPNNIKEKNTCVEQYYQLGKYDVHTLTLLDLLEQVLTERFFDELRSVQQVGYNVSCGVRHTYGILGFCFFVLTNSHTSEQVQSSVSTFAADAADYIMEISDKDYISNVESLREHFLQPPNSLSVAARDAWTEIEEKREIFDHGRVQAAIVANISKKELAAFCFALFCSERRLLVTHSSVIDRFEEYCVQKSKDHFTFITKPEDLHALTLLYASCI
jgi:nardilysin